MALCLAVLALYNHCTEVPCPRINSRSSSPVARDHLPIGKRLESARQAATSDAITWFVRRDKVTCSARDPGVSTAGDDLDEPSMNIRGYSSVLTISKTIHFQAREARVTYMVTESHKRHEA
ncbi:hypothetical protein K474DRAFT_878212 [Panus rudis PR-1116 ss-1]|nr:hypothetical protein K474DRAFT_878212 [Panus rudis PR-1116 ss-1]